MDVQRYGPWALVVGGSEGMGRVMAQMLAKDGFNLVLVARKPEPLAEVARELEARGAEVRTVAADMSKSDALERVRAATDDIEVGLLIYNAGANNTRGAFVELEPAVYRSVINITVIGQSEFAHHYGALMRARGRGGIVLTGSTASFLGSPTLAAYCGSKAFSRIFSESLWAECREFGVDVLHVTLGLTATPAMERLGYDLSAAERPEDVARATLENISNGPLLFTGNTLEMVTNAARLTDRAEVIETFASRGRR